MPQAIAYNDLLRQLDDLKRRLNALERGRPASAASRLRADVIETLENQSSATYADLATAGPEVTVDIPLLGTSGKGQLVLWFSAAMYGSESSTGYMGFELSGANTLAAADARAIYAAVDLPVSAGRVVFLDDLDPGSTTVTAKYRKDGPGTVATFEYRTIAAMPLF